MNPFTKTLNPFTKTLFAAACAFLTGCSGTGDGIAPPLDRVYFPVALALDPAGQHLFVANSDFDLQFNGGTLQSLDTTRILSFMPAYCPPGTDCRGRCGALGDASAADQILVPGPCAPVVIGSPQGGGGSLLADAIKIGAFATDLLYLTRPTNESAGAAGRIFLPLRGSASVAFVDADEDGGLRCDVDGQRQCDAAFSVKRGVDHLGRTIELPKEPMGLAATLDGHALLGIHQQSEGAQLSVFDHDWSGGLTLRSLGSLAPTTFGGIFRPSAIALVPPSRAQASRSPAFLLTARTSPEVRLIKFLDAEASAPEPPQAREVGSVGVNANAFGSDSRGIALDSSERGAAEANCAATHSVSPECALSGQCEEAKAGAYLQCLSAAGRIADAVFVANRTPASLLVGDIQQLGTGEAGLPLPAFKQTIPLSFGPSRVVLGRILNEQGKLELRVFVLCFDSRLIFVYDPVRGQLETEIRTGRGPHALVVDEQRHVAYVAHFTDSYIGVIDLDRSHTGDYAKIVLSVGHPSAPRATK